MILGSGSQRVACRKLTRGTQAIALNALSSDTGAARVRLLKNCSNHIATDTTVKRASRAVQHNRLSLFRLLGSSSHRIGGRRKLRFEPLETRRVLTLPATQSFAEGDLLVYNGPTVDTVNDTASFDAFIDFAGDVDSYLFAPQFSGTYTIDVGDFGNAIDPEVAVYNATTGARIAYNDDVSQFNDDAHLAVNLTADVRYVVAVADMPGTTAGNVSIVVSAPFRTGSFLLTPDSFGDATTAVTLDVPTDIDFYSITAPADATGGLTISTVASTVSQRLALFDSSGALLQGPFISIAISNALPNQEYRVAVYSDQYAAAGSLQMNVNFDTPASASPIPQTLVLGHCGKPSWRLIRMRTIQEFPIRLFSVFRVSVRSVLCSPARCLKSPMR